MDVLRETLMYATDPVVICMKQFTPHEQYECIRMMSESKAPIRVCTHESTSEWVLKVLQSLQVTFVQCWVQEPAEIPL